MEVGEVDADEEIVTGEEWSCPKIECWKNLCNVQWLCARGGSSEKTHDLMDVNQVVMNETVV